MTAAEAPRAKLRIGGFNLHYGEFHALKDVNLEIEAKAFPIGGKQGL